MSPDKKEMLVFALQSTAIMAAIVIAMFMIAILLLPGAFAVCSNAGVTCSSNSDCCSGVCLWDVSARTCLDVSPQRNIFQGAMSFTNTGTSNDGRDYGLQFAGKTGSVVDVNFSLAPEQVNVQGEFRWTAGAYKSFTVMGFGGTHNGGIKIHSADGSGHFSWFRYDSASNDIEYLLPSSAPPATGYVLSVSSVAGGIDALSWTTVGSLVPTMVTGIGSTDQVAKWSGTSTLTTAAPSESGGVWSFLGDRVNMNSGNPIRFYDATNAFYTAVLGSDFNADSTGDLGIDPGGDGTYEYRLVHDADGTCRNNEVLTHVDSTGGITCKPVAPTGGAACLPEVQADGSLGTSSICHNVGAPGEFIATLGAGGYYAPATDNQSTLGAPGKTWSALYLGNGIVTEAHPFSITTNAAIGSEERFGISAGAAIATGRVQYMDLVAGTSGTITATALSANYVAAVADGTGIDGTCSSSGCTYTPTLDLTEVTPTAVFGAGSFTSLGFDAGATDPRINVASGQIGFDHDSDGTNSLTVTSSSVVMDPGDDGTADVTVTGSGLTVVPDTVFTGGEQAIKLGPSSGNYTAGANTAQVRAADTTVPCTTDGDTLAFCINDGPAGCGDYDDMCFRVNPITDKFAFTGGSGARLSLNGTDVPSAGGVNSWTSTNSFTGQLNLSGNIAAVSNQTSELFSTDFQANYTTGYLFTVKQTTGNPTSGVSALLSVQTTDADVNVADLTAQGTSNGVRVDKTGKMAAVGTGLVVATADAHTGHMIYSDATATTYDTGTLVCAAVGYGSCVTTYTPAGTNNACSNDYNTGVATPFYAVCR